MSLSDEVMANENSAHFQVASQRRESTCIKAAAADNQPTVAA